MPDENTLSPYDESLENMPINIALPEPQTMQLHLGSANPHPQYLLITSMVEAFNNLVGLADMNDVVVDPSLVLQNKVLAFDGGAWVPKDINTVVNIPMGTYNDHGIVKLATVADVENDVSAAITPSTMKSYVSTYVAGMTATNDTYGTVKILSTREQHASAITRGVIDGIVEWAGINRFVNVYWMNPNDNTDYIYSTYASDVSQVTAFNNLPGIVYNVYRDGVMSNHVNTTNLEEHVVVHSTGTVYGITACCQLVVEHEGIVKRANIVTCDDYGDGNINVNDVDDTTFTKVSGINGLTSHLTFDEARESATYAVVQKGITWVNIAGSVHDLNCSVSGWMIVHNVSGMYEDEEVAGYENWCYPKCVVAVNSRGHLEYATVENAGHIAVGGGGIVEHVIVHNTQSNSINPDHNGLTIESTGSGYHITLNGSYARATIMGYAEDVRVYSGCALDLAYPTARVKNLTLYNGAYLRMTSGATVDGLVQYPGAMVDMQHAPGMVCSIITEANCHEPDKVVSLVGEISNIYTTVVTETSSVETTRQFIKFYGATSYVTNLSYSTAMLVENATLVHSSAGTGETPETFTGDPQIYVYATDTPRGLIRVNVELQTSLNGGLIPLESRAEVITSMYKYEDVKMVNRYNANTMTKNYIISAPDGMYDDLRNHADMIEWKVIF